MDMHTKIRKDCFIVKDNIYFYYLLDNIVRISYLLSFWFVSCGFYKIFFYKTSSEDINVYVGGDAYNYIIKSQLATSYFVLALLFTVLGSTFLIINKLDKKEA